MTDRPVRCTHVGAYGVIARGDEILLIRKGRGPYTGRLDLPGGTIEFGETPSHALCREIEEETGLSVARADLVQELSHCVQWVRSDGKSESLHHIGFLYEARVQASGDIRADGDGQDSLGSAWLKIHELKEEDLTPFAKDAVSRAVARSSAMSG